MHCRYKQNVYLCCSVCLLRSETVLLSYKGYVQAIGHNCNQLQSLNLGWCEDVGDVGVMNLAYGCPDLRSLDLCGCVCITGISSADVIIRPSRNCCVVKRKCSIGCFI